MRLLPVLLLSGCAMQTIDAGDPDAVIQFPSTRVPVEVKDCVKSRAIREIYGREIQDGHDGDRAFVSESMSGAFGTYGYVWTVDVYPDHAEIRWMSTLGGSRDDLLEQIVRECGGALDR